MQKQLIYSKDIVTKYNISYSTVTHYTDLGFFTVVGKKGNRRLYDEKEIKVRAEQIKTMAGEGYPLRLIRKELIG